jgi:pyruvate,orthophosphate dikinase
MTAATQAADAMITVRLRTSPWRRADADAAAVVVLYEDFCVFNAELKPIMSDWQLKRDGITNDHHDAHYDHHVLQRLVDLHRRVGPLLRRLVQLSPQLAAYGGRLDRAAARVVGGDHSYVAKIISDSYRTTWFELHEDLMSLAGLKRAGEPASANRAGSRLLAWDKHFRRAALPFSRTMLRNTASPSR